MVVLLVTLALAMHTDPEGNEPPADAPVAAEPEQPLVETAPEEPVAPPTSETVVRSNKLSSRSRREGRLLISDRVSWGQTNEPPRRTCESS